MTVEIIILLRWRQRSEVNSVAHTDVLLFSSFLSREQTHTQKHKYSSKETLFLPTGRSFIWTFNQLQLKLAS